MSGMAEEAVWPPLIRQNSWPCPLIGQSGLQCSVQVKNLTILLLSDTEEEITHLDGLQTLIKLEPFSLRSDGDPFVLNKMPKNVMVDVDFVLKFVN